MYHRPLVKSAYQKNNFLISQPKHMLWVLNYFSIKTYVVGTQKNRLNDRDGSFEHPKHMLNIMGKKIFAILC